MALIVVAGARSPTSRTTAARRGRVSAGRLVFRHLGCDVCLLRTNRLSARTTPAPRAGSIRSANLAPVSPDVTARFGLAGRAALSPKRRRTRRRSRFERTCAAEIADAADLLDTYRVATSRWTR